MSRVRTNIRVSGRNLWTLFDTGAVNTYVLAEVAQDLPGWKLPEPKPAVLGGKVHSVTQACALIGQLEGLWIDVETRIVSEIGTDEDGKKIEILFGALAMEKWRIRIDPYRNCLDLSNYPKEFVEF